MQYRTFGKTGMKVSAVTLGTWGMGGVGWDVYDDDVKEDALKAAWEEGINLIDTAPAYNNGEAERFIGKTLKKLGIRNDVQIATKCGNFFVDGKVYVRDGRYEKIIGQCEESLRNLQTDHIDLMLIHWPDLKTPFEETMDALSRLKKDGKILHIGVSNFTTEQMEQISRFGEIEAFQPQYSMVFREHEEAIRWAASQGMGVMTYGSLGGGILSGRYREEREFAETDSRRRFYKHFHGPMFHKVMSLLEVMDEISERNDGMPLSQIALLWCYSRPFVSTCITGAQKRERVQENARAFDRELNSEDMKLLDEAVEKLSEI